jgi:hypothetical protein
MKLEGDGRQPGKYRNSLRHVLVVCKTNGAVRMVLRCMGTCMWRAECTMGDSVYNKGCCAHGATVQGNLLTCMWRVECAVGDSVYNKGCCAHGATVHGNQ